jgi:primary-amine oxidase
MQVIADELAVAHPLEPLSAEEMTAASAIVRAGYRMGAQHRFVSITLEEPTKEALDAFTATGEWPAREAFVVVYDREQRQVTEVVVSLTTGEVVSSATLDAVQPSFGFDELAAAEAAVKADPRWQEALRRRGVTAFELAMVDPWPAGNQGPDDDPGRRRITRALTWIRTDRQDNGYARPVEGLIVAVDLDTATVVEVEDHGVVPLPPRAGNYTPALITQVGNIPWFDAPRADLQPIEIRQPDGPSFQLDGHAVAWQNWRFRIGFTLREGIVLHQVSYVDRGRPRQVIHRASVAEMWVPYGDPAPTHRMKNVFDEGEAGMGLLANSLQLGCDCLGEIRYLDGVVNGYHGEPLVLSNAICIHEEDTGVSWKHTDLRSGTVEVRRGRRLVISSFATVGNYEYGYFWYLHTDGTIAFEVKLTGIISTGAVLPGSVPDHGNLVAPGLYGPHHQHCFSVRLDVAIDGDRNSVYEVDSVLDPPGPDNPVGNAWRTRQTLLTDEASAQRVADPGASRTWMIVNNSVRNQLGQPVGYQLVPGPAVLPFFQPDAPALQRALFATKHLWVTAFDPRQRYAAGDYPYQHPGGAGLPTYTAGNRSIVDTDIVLWHTLIAHHVVRPEDWPVMPVTTVGFQLRPVGFFVGNPAVDLPRSDPAHCH